MHNLWQTLPEEAVDPINALRSGLPFQFPTNYVPTNHATARDGTYEVLKVLSNALRRLLKIHRHPVGHRRKN